MRQATAQRRVFRCLRYGSRTKKNLVKKGFKMQLQPTEVLSWADRQLGLIKAGIRLLDGAKL